MFSEVACKMVSIVSHFLCFDGSVPLVRKISFCPKPNIQLRGALYYARVEVMRMVKTVKLNQSTNNYR